ATTIRPKRTRPRLVLAYCTPAVSISHARPTVTTECTASMSEPDTTPSTCGPTTTPSTTHSTLDGRPTPLTDRSPPTRKLPKYATSRSPIKRSSDDISAPAAAAERDAGLVERARDDGRRVGLVESALGDDLVARALGVDRQKTHARLAVLARAGLGHHAAHFFLRSP